MISCRGINGFSIRSYLPGRKPLVTLRDAALYVTKLPKAEQQIEEWQTAVENLINAAEVGGGWLMLARIGVMRALNRHVERVFNSSRKDPRWGRRKLKREIPDGHLRRRGLDRDGYRRPQGRN